MKFAGPVALLRDLSQGSDTFLLFERPRRIIQASDRAGALAALDEIEAACAAGRHLAGYFAYEFGYALLRRLHGLQWPRRTEPLLWFGIFDAPTRVLRKDLEATGRAYAGPLKHEWDAGQYARRFESARDYVRAGDAYQINLSFRSRFAVVGDPFSLFLALHDRALASHSAFVDTGEHQILSLSPELFFEASASGEIIARPMKGTAARGSDERTDEAAKKALAVSEKNRAENLMIVDLMRSDLGRIARLGSVTASDLFTIETYPTLHTMVSTIAAQLDPEVGPSALIQALFPCGSITGAPKIRAMEIIRELEESPRGVYCGAVGYFSPDGGSAFNVAIRTIAISGAEASLGLGGAILHDSESADEFSECLLKGRFFESGRKSLSLIETLRFDHSFIRLDLHLERMARSAESFSMEFDRDAALAALRASVELSQQPMRVRLTLDEEGRFDCRATPLGDAPAIWSFTISPNAVDSRDVLLRHKTTWREFHDSECARLAMIYGADETLFVNERGELTEGSRANLFIRRGSALLTPRSECGLLPGVLRRSLIEAGHCSEAVLWPEDLRTADEVRFGSSLRGLIRAVPAPGVSV